MICINHLLIVRILHLTYLIITRCLVTWPSPVRRYCSIKDLGHDKNFIVKSLFVSLTLFSEVVYVTIGNSIFCLALYLTGVYFQGELLHVGDVGGQNFKCRPIRAREIGGIRLQEKLYVSRKL